MGETHSTSGKERCQLDTFGKLLSVSNKTGFCYSHPIEDIREQQRLKRAAGRDQNSTGTRRKPFDPAEWDERTKHIPRREEALAFLETASRLSGNDSETLRNVTIRTGGVGSLRDIRSLLMHLFISELHMKDKDAALFFGYKHAALSTNLKDARMMLEDDQEAIALYARIRAETGK